MLNFYGMDQWGDSVGAKVIYSTMDSQVEPVTITLLNFYYMDQWGDSVGAKLIYSIRTTGWTSDHWTSTSTESITDSSLIALHGGYTNADYATLIIECGSTSRYCILLVEI